MAEPQAPTSGRVGKRAPFHAVRHGSEPPGAASDRAQRPARAPVGRPESFAHACAATLLVGNFGGVGVLAVSGSVWPARACAR